MDIIMFFIKRSFPLVFTLYIVLPTNAPTIIPAAPQEIAINVLRKNFSIKGEPIAASCDITLKPR
jgi:hypothetical protein